MVKSRRSKKTIMFDIITIGSGTLDVFISTGARMFRPCQSCPDHVKVPFGSKLLVDRISFFTGGGGTNTAVGFSRLGFRTAWIGKIGDDTTGETILLELTHEKVDTSFVAIAKGKTSGYSLILDAKGHDRTVLAYKGCNDLLRPTEVLAKPLQSPWIYCSSQLGGSLKTILTIVEKARRKGTKIAFNPSSYMITLEKKVVKKILFSTHILIFNSEEAEMLVGRAGIKQTMKRIHDLGPRFAVVTDGAHGAHGSDGSRIWHCKAPPVHVVESTGAGDSFATGCVAGLMKEWTLPEAMKIGMAESASVIQHMGAKHILLTWKQALKAVRQTSRGACRQIF